MKLTASIKQSIQTLKVFCLFFLDTYNPKALVVSLLLFLTIGFFPIKFIPDILGFYNLENKQDLVWKYLNISLGFSGILITILLVGYNFYLKSTRRQTFNFIFENQWLKIILSLFGSLVLLNLLGFFTLNLIPNAVEILYFLTIFTVAYLVSLIPLAFLSLKNTNSISRVKKIIETIDETDINQIINPEWHLENKSFEDIERNRIIILKDIGTNAIREGDWVLPQWILNKLHEKLADKFESKNYAEAYNFLHCFLFTCNHYVRVSIKTSDHITTNVIFNFSTGLYNFLPVNKQSSRHFEAIDNFIKELCYAIIESKDFTIIRDNMIRDLVDCQVHNLLKISFSDNELPTMEYFSKTPGYDRKDVNEDAESYWRYIKHTHILLVNDVLTFAILRQDNRVYNYFHWKLQSIPGNSKIKRNLTSAQYNTLIADFIYAYDDLISTLVANKIFSHLDILSNITIVDWINTNNKTLYRRGLVWYSETLKKLVNSKQMDYIMLDNYFYIGRTIFHSNISADIKKEILFKIFSTACQLFDKMYDSYRLKYELQKQMNWLNSYFANNPMIVPELKDEVLELIGTRLDDYDYSKFPEWVD